MSICIHLSLSLSLSLSLLSLSLSLSLSLIPIPESEEVTALRVAVQDLDTQIEEQQLKIQNTPNKMLRVMQNLMEMTYDSIRNIFRN